MSLAPRTGGRLRRYFNRHVLRGVRDTSYRGASCRVLDEPGLPKASMRSGRQQRIGQPSDVTSHSFRKSLATMIDDAGLSARIGADQLGHAKVSITQDRYMRRGNPRTHGLAAQSKQ